MLHLNEFYTLNESSTDFVALGTVDNFRTALEGDTVKILNVEVQGWNTRVTVEFVDVNRKFVPSSLLGNWTQRDRFYYIDLKNETKNVLPQKVIFIERM